MKRLKNVLGTVAVILCLLDNEALAGSKIFFIHSDHLNTPQVITDANQQVVWKVEKQAPFGEMEINQDPDGDGEELIFNLRFPGQYFDKETGLHYNYYRDYDPSTGRYLQSDPIGLEGGINTYAYVKGNPLTNSDPMGLVSNPSQYGMDYGPEWDEHTIPDFDDPCGCFAKAFLGYAEVGVATAHAATGPYVGKPRGGVAGGGPSGKSTSVLSEAVHQVNRRYGKSVATVAVRNAGRFASRMIPYVGTALLLYDVKVYNDCMEECEEDNCGN